MANETMLKFGYPNGLIHDYEHWAVLLRPKQVTLGSLILVAKGNATAFGQLPPGAYLELATVTRDIEATLHNEVAYEKINYLMLMMVDPHVHFHIFPRYSGSRTIEGFTLDDVAWPGPPDLKSAPDLPSETLGRLCLRLCENWLIKH
jgi:diadenosine tetraphosphate (Ap4A) HIT family hydrolase